MLMTNPRRPAVTLVIFVLLGGSALSLAIHQYTRSLENERIVAEFSHRADGREALARQIVDYYATGVYALKSLFEGSGDVTRTEFRNSSSDILARYPGITALEWVPLVPQSRRKEFEAATAREIGRPFQITERRPDGTIGPAASRPEYYPILYVEPAVRNERAFGYDAGTSPSRPSLDRARATGQFVITAQFQLVQGNRGVVMTWPVFDSPESGRGARAFQGFVQGVFRVDELLAQTHLRSPTTSLEMLYVDDSNPDPANRILYAWLGDGSSEMAARLGEAAFRQSLHREYPFSIGGRRWIALYRPTATWLAEQRTWQPELWLVAGLLVTVLLAVLVATLALRAASIAREVADRTAELTESRRQLSGLLHALPGVAYRCAYDRRLHVVFLSEGALPLTGYRPDQLISGEIPLETLIDPEDLEHVRRVIADAVATRRDAEVECRIRTREGPEKWVLARGRGIYGNDGGLLFFEGLAIDVTGRRQAEAEKLSIERKLLESQKLESLGLLAGGIAHDFNNLLTGILGHANLARTSAGVSEGVLNHLRNVETGATRAAELCQQMLAYSGRGRFLVEPLDLNQLIRDTLPLLQSSLVRARVRSELAGQPVVVTGDVTQLRQVVMNLVMNAADALPPTGGDIRIRTGRREFNDAELARARVGETCAPGNYAFLEITDTGCGMDPATQARIFDPFFTTKFTGRGLGLAAALGIVRSHSGALNVESEPGRGSVFTLILPACAEPLTDTGEASTATPWRRGGRVLVVDDEAPVREVAAQMIRTFGFFVVVAADGAEAVKTVGRDAAFDLVFLDLTMPGLDGIETLTQLRKIAPRIRVLLVSGYSENERIADLASDGTVVFMQKPFTRAKLEQKLREALG